MARLLEPKAQIPEERRRFSNPALKALILPVLIEQFLALLVGIVDTLMISYAGEAAVSSVSLVDQLNNVFIMAFTALASGGAVVASQYVGREDKENGDMAASQLVMSISAISILLGLVVLLFGRQIFGLLFGRVEQEVLDTGMVYMRITAFSFPFLALYNGCAGLFRSMGRTKILMQVSIAMNGINVA
ncbi:MAG: MATE family efflux transporter, partial [Acutalibacter sp.]|nr:MATE family efflux transporter [Acutalibacter sp.]